MEIKLSDIKITDEFKHYPPSTKKLATCYNRYRSRGFWDREIVVDKNNVLVDGYVKYLVCKLFDIEVVKVEVR